MCRAPAMVTNFDGHGLKTMAKSDASPFSFLGSVFKAPVTVATGRTWIVSTPDTPSTPERPTKVYFLIDTCIINQRQHKAGGITV